MTGPRRTPRLVVAARSLAALALLVAAGGCGNGPGAGDEPLLLELDRQEYHDTEGGAGETVTYRSPWEPADLIDHYRQRFGERATESDADGVWTIVLRDERPDSSGFESATVRPVTDAEAADLPTGTRSIATETRGFEPD